MKKYVFGVDVGGTTIKMGFFTVEGELLEKWEIPTRRENNSENVLPDIAAAIDSKLAERGIDKAEVSGVGFGVPGPVTKDGIIQMNANLGWRNKHVAKELGELTGLPCMGGNDVKTAGLGERWKGGAAEYDNAVFITLGTGVAAAIIVEGKVVTGSVGAGGEIGHIHVEDNETEMCACKKYGCLEQYSSATGIVRLAKRRLAKDDTPSAIRKDNVTAKDVFDAVKAGDALAIEVAEQFGDYLGKGMAIIAVALNPEIFVIGGGVSKAGEILFDYIVPAFKKYSFSAVHNAKFAIATLGNDAGIYGAAKLILG